VTTPMNSLTPGLTTSHTTTANLPVLDYTIITTDAGLATACAHWQQSPALALDTEFMRVSTFYPELGLLQIADAAAVTRRFGSFSRIRADLPERSRR